MCTQQFPVIITHNTISPSHIHVYTLYYSYGGLMYMYMYMYYCVYIHVETCVHVHAHTPHMMYSVYMYVVRFDENNNITCTQHM